MPITSSRFYVTNETLRKKLIARGVDPDGEGVGDYLHAHGMGPMLGEQPDTGAAGNAQALGQGFAKEIANTALGIADLPLAIGRYTGSTQKKIEALPQSPVQLENPIASGVGQLGGFLAPLLAGGAASKVPGAIGKVGRGVSLSSWSEKALMAERGAATLAEAEALPAAKGILAFGAKPAQAIAYKAAKGATQMGVLSGLQPGDIEERLSAAKTGALMGLAGGATEAVSGAPRIVSLLRGAGGNALAPSPFEVPGLGAHGTSAAIGGVMSLFNKPYRASKPAISKAQPDLSRPLREPGAKQTGVPAEGTVDRLVFDVLRNPAAKDLDSVASLLTPERFSTLAPETQAELQAALGSLPEYASLFKEGAAPAVEKAPTFHPRPELDQEASSQPSVSRTAPSSFDPASETPVAEPPVRPSTSSMLEASAIEAIDPHWKRASNPVEAREAARRAYFDDVVAAVRRGETIPAEVHAQPGMAEALERASIERRALATRPPQDVWEAAQRPDIKAKAEETLAAGGDAEALAHTINEALSSDDPSFSTLIDEPKRLKVATLALDQLESRRQLAASQGEMALPQGGGVLRQPTGQPRPEGLLGASERLNQPPAPSVYETQPVRADIPRERSLMTLPRSEDYAEALGPERTSQITAGVREPLTDGEYGLVLARIAEAPVSDSTPRPVSRELVVYTNGNGHQRAIVKPLAPLPPDSPVLQRLARLHATTPQALAAARKVIEAPSTSEKAIFKKTGLNVETITEALVARGFEEQAARVAAQTVNDSSPLRIYDPPRTVAEAASLATRQAEKETRRVKARQAKAPSTQSEAVSSSRERVESEAVLSPATRKSLERAAKRVERSAGTLEKKTASFVKQAQRLTARESKKASELLKKTLSTHASKLKSSEAKLNSSLLKLKTTTSTIASIREESLKPENISKRGVVAARIGKLAESLSAQQQEVSALAESLANRRASLGELQSPEATVLVSKLDSIQQLIENESAILTDRLSAPAAQSDVALSTVREALAMIGQEAMGPARFEALPPSMQALHVAKRLLAYSDARNKSHQKARYALLDRFFRTREGREFKSNEARRAEYPILAAVYDSKLTTKATESINRELTRLGDRGFSIRHETYGGARSLDRWVVSDELTPGSMFEFSTPEAAAYALDTLAKIRESSSDFTPPGVDTILDSSSGPRPPLPPGSIGIDGERPASGVPRMKPGEVEISQRRRIFSVPFRVYAEIDRLIMKASGGVDLGLTRLFRAATPAYSAAGRDARSSLHGLAELSRDSGVKGRAAGLRIAQAMRFVDDGAYSIQKEVGVEAARSNLPDLIERASTSAGLSQAERRFAFGDESAEPGSLASEGAQGWFRRLYSQLDISSEEVVGYFPRSESFVRALSSKGRFTDPLDWGTKDWAREQLRQRGEAQLPADSSYAQLLDEFRLEGSENFFDIAESYAFQGFRVKHLALHVGEINATIKELLDRNGPDALGKNSLEFIRNSIASLISKPSKPDDLAGASQFKHRISAARSLMKLHDRLASENPAVKPLAGALKSIYERLAISGLEGRENGLAATFLRYHRQSIFGLSPMRALRDSVTTSLFQLYPRFKTTHFARAMVDVLSPSGHAEMVERYKERGYLDMDDFLRFEEARTFSKLSSNVNEGLSWMYRKNDTFTRMLAARLSEISTEAASERYHKVGGGEAGWKKFIQITGLDTYKSLMTPSQALEIRSLIDRGNLLDATTLVARVHLDGAVFNYLRPNAPQYNQVWYGRLFGQYGTWPANMIGSMWEMYSAPLQHHGATGGIVRGAVIASKYALAAEAVYAAGAYLGVDSSSWIPFVHNTLVYDGGPALSMLDSIRGFFQGDSRAEAELADDPGRFLGRLLKQNVPFPGSDILRRTMGQLIIPEDAEGLREVLGLAEQQEAAADRWKVSLGFRPLAQETRRKPNFLQRISTPGPVAFQDFLSESSGGVLPPGSEEAVSSSTFGR